MVIGDGNGWIPAYIGLGSNLGDRERYLSDAIRLLEEDSGICVEARSSIYETAPVGFTEQPSFLNMVIRVATNHSPEGLLSCLADVEGRLGRKRELRWGPRTVDLDLLLFGSDSVQTSHLIVPHPRMLERAFVLIPLQEIYPSDVLPHGESLSDLLQTLHGKEGVKRWIKKL